MITLYEALDIFKKIQFRLPLEEVKLTDTTHRILGEDIYSDVNIPPFDKSAMDGYACKHQDLTHTLKVIGTLYAGSKEKFEVTNGTCVKIMTGAPVPNGSDTVIMIEDTEDPGNNKIRFSGKSTKTNICKLGEDVMKNDLVLKTGTRLLPHHIAVLASVGKAIVKVSAQAKIALLSTGSELVEPDQKPDIAQIRNSNAYSIMAQLQAMNVQADYAGLVADKKTEIKNLISELLDSHDIIIITGGASDGEHDYIPQILQELKLELKFNKLAIQPGKPFSFAASENKFCFGLSGNPVSALVQFEVLIKPFIFHLLNCTYSPNVILSEMAHNIKRKKANRLKFFPVLFNASGQVEEIRFNGSAHIAGLSNADGFALFPQNCEALNAGEKIEILLMK